MRQRVVAVTGISGVGKTTFLRELADLVTFQHITGGSLIAANREASPDQRDALRYADLDENQRLLIKGFEAARDPAADLVVFDGHVIIDDGSGLQKLPAHVFRVLGVTMMVHLEAEPTRISINRFTDHSPDFRNSARVLTNFAGFGAGSALFSRARPPEVACSADLPP